MAAISDVLSAHALPVYDATDEQLASIRNSIFITIPNIAHTLKNWVDVHSAVMRGNGIAIQRSDEVQEEWTKFISDKTPLELEIEFAKWLGWWDEEAPVTESDQGAPVTTKSEVKFLPVTGLEVPQVLKDLHNDSTWVQFIEAVFPIDLPSDVKHHILWIRAPMTTRQTFHAEAGEVIPHEHLLDTDRLDDFIEFIHAHDAFGSNVEPTRYYPDLKFGEKLRKVSDRLPHGYLGETSMEEGIKAMAWSSRYVTDLIKCYIPGKDFVWFRVNRSFRNFHVPNEIHVLVHEK